MGELLSMVDQVWFTYLSIYLELCGRSAMELIVEKGDKEEPGN